MKMVMLAFALAGIPAAGALSQDKKDPESILITVDCQDSTIGEILDMLKELSGVPIEVDENARKKLDSSAKVNFKVQDIGLKSALVLLVQPQGLTVKVVDKKKLVITVPKDK